MQPNTKRTILITLWCALALVVLAAAGWFGYNAYKFLPYENTQNKFYVKYPRGWNKLENWLGATVVFVRPKETALDIIQPNVNVTIEEAPAEVATLDSFSKKIVQQFTAVFKKTINVLEDKPVNFAGRRGHRMVLESPKPDNLKMMFVWTIKGSFAYTITFTARADQYEKFYPLVEQMVNSFQFK